MSYVIWPQPEPDDTGGVRPTGAASFQCEEGCEGAIARLWLDYTTFYPDLSDEDNPPGLCELRSTLVEFLFCRPRLPRRLPCRNAHRVIGDTAIAVKYVNSELACGKQYFKPFHRSGKQQDIEMGIDDRFGKPGPIDATRYFQIAREFVQNFDYKDMQIRGDQWLALDDGYLIGSPPKSESRVAYQFYVSAENSNGSDEVGLKIVVNP